MIRFPGLLLESVLWIVLRNDTITCWGCWRWTERVIAFYDYLSGSQGIEGKIKGYSQNWIKDALSADGYLRDGK